MTDADDLYTLAITGLRMKLDKVAIHITNKSNSITMAALNVLKDWRRSRTNRQVAFREMCDALNKPEMNSYEEDILLKRIWEFDSKTTISIFSHSVTICKLDTLYSRFSTVQ